MPGICKHWGKYDSVFIRLEAGILPNLLITAVCHQNIYCIFCRRCLIWVPHLNEKMGTHDHAYVSFAVKDGRPGIKGRNGGYHPTSLSYLNSEIQMSGACLRRHFKRHHNSDVRLMKISNLTKHEYPEWRKMWAPGTHFINEPIRPENYVYCALCEVYCLSNAQTMCTPWRGDKEVMELQVHRIIMFS